MAPDTTSAPRASAAAPYGPRAACACARRGPARDRGTRPDLLIVPGGEGTRRPDPELVGWLRAHGRQARAPGLGVHRRLPAGRGRAADGRRVTTHWAYCGALAARYPGRSTSTRSRSSSGTGTSPPRPGSPPGSTSRWPWWRTTSAGTRHSISPGTWWCSCAVRETRPSSAPSSPRSWRTGSRCGTCSSGSRTIRRRTCRWRRWPAGPACRRASSPVPSRPRSACRRDVTSTGSGSRRPGATWRTPPTAWSRPPAACGYGTPEAMRRAFLRALGVSPGEYRRRFRPAVPLIQPLLMQPLLTQPPRQTKESHADRHRALRPVHCARRDRPLPGAQRTAGRGGGLRRRASRAHQRRGGQPDLVRRSRSSRRAGVRTSSWCPAAPASTARWRTARCTSGSGPPTRPARGPRRCAPARSSWPRPGC